jgi:excisionase family DNA binding protein
LLDLRGDLCAPVARKSRTDSPGQPRLLTVREAAKVLGVRMGAVCRACREGELPHFRARNAIRVRRVALKAYPARARR